jgi:cytochrome P450
LTDEGITVVGAGSHTVAWTLSVACYYLLSSSIMLQNLKTELSTIQDLNENLSTLLAKLEKLPYLTAVIKEALRLAYGVSMRVPRIAPDATLRYKDWMIPPGTAVGMTTVLLHQDPEIFPQPLEFRPERWLNGGSSKLDRYLTSFSAGSRVCLGYVLSLYQIVSFCVSSRAEIGFRNRSTLDNKTLSFLARYLPCSRAFQSLPSFYGTNLL